MAVPDSLDHVLLGASDLANGVEWFEQLTGIRASAGGVHPGRGARNALVSLGGARYLEIIAPDPMQTGATHPFRLGSLAQPRLITFAMRTGRIQEAAVSFRRAGDVMDGSRQTASGGLLRWKTLRINSDVRVGEIDPIPFFIEWERDSMHPAKTAPQGCTIEDLRFEHPRAPELKALFDAIGVAGNVTTGERVRIIATLETPKGRVTLE